MRIYQPTGADRFPQSMIENTTEFDWDELPDHLKDVIRGAARAVNEWAAQQENPIVGEVVPDAAALPQADLLPHIERVQAIAASSAAMWAAPCHICGRAGDFKASAWRSDKGKRFFCHNDERSCYNDYRGRYFE